MFETSIRKYAPLLVISFQKLISFNRGSLSFNETCGPQQSFHLES